MEQLAVVWGNLNLIKDISIFLKNEVEMVTINDYQFFLDASEQKLLEVKRVFESARIRIHSVHAPIGNGKNLIAFESKVRRQQVRRCQKLIYNLSIAGVGIMVFHIGSIENESYPAFSIGMESLYPLVEWAEKYQVILAMENGIPNDPISLCFNSQTLLKFLEEVNSPWLKACYDTGHAHIGEKKGEKIRDAIKNLGDWIATIHMQDNDGGAHDLHLQPGYGTINWDDFVEVLQNIHYGHPITIEANPWGGASMRYMLNEVRALLKDGGADIPTNLTLKPNKNGLNEFPPGWKTERAGDIMIRCRKCGHYVIWGPEGGYCVCDERGN